MPDKNSSICGAAGLGCNNRTDNTTCIDVDKIYDSVRDKDCIEDLKVFLNECGQEIIDHATNIRCKCIDLLWAHISVNNVAFNRGFFSVDIRYFFKICFEACIHGGKSQEFCGLAVFDKQCVLFGSEGNVSIFTSDPTNNNSNFCVSLSDVRGDFKTNKPKVVLEVANPIVLGVKLVDKNFKFGCCCCTSDQVPEGICGCCFGNSGSSSSSSCSDSTSENICSDFGNKSLFCSIGLFSLIRMERPVSLLLNAVEFCVPAKESAACSDTDPCSLFKSMNFPTSDFFPPGGCSSPVNGLPIATRRCD
jgi:hypothetical protein